MALSKYASELELVEVSFAELQNVDAGRMAKRDGLSFKDTKNTFWWRMDLDGDAVGVVGLIKANPTTWRLKSAFVLPEWRRQGFYTIAGWVLMRKTYEVGGEWIEAIVRPASAAALKQLGWTHKNGASNLVHLNVKQFFEGVDMSRDQTELLAELCPEVF